MKKLILLFSIVMLLTNCGEKKQTGIEKTYVVKVVFMDKHEDTLKLISTCRPKLTEICCSGDNGMYLTINCDPYNRVATSVKYFSIISEK